MHGRPFYKLALVATLAAFGLSVTAPELAAANKRRSAKPKPAEEAVEEPIFKRKPLRTDGSSVVLIIADGLGDWVGWMNGHPQLRTPNMDRLARMGVRFNNASAAATLSNPSRTALLTSLAPWESGVTSNDLDWRRAMPLLGKATLPEYFRTQGFVTAGGGKVFHASHAGPKNPAVTARGGIRGMEQDIAWDERFPKQGVQMGDFPLKLQNQSFNGLNDWQLDWAALDAKEKDMPDDQVVAWAETFLTQKRKNPFFLTIGLSSPGTPWYVPRRFYESFPLSGIQSPDTMQAVDQSEQDQALDDLITKKQNLKPAIQARLAAVAYCDALVGRLLDALEKSPQKDSTIVVFTSDRGQAMGQGGNWSDGTLLPAATRVPLVVYAPGITVADTSCDQPVSLVDIYATLCELVNVPKPEALAGLSLLPQLKDVAAIRTRPALTSSGKEKEADFTVNTAEWRYTLQHNGKESLFATSQGVVKGSDESANAEQKELKDTLKTLLPEKWASPYRTFDLVKFDASADGSVTYWLQTGDAFSIDQGPDIVGRGLDFEFQLEYRASKDANSVLMSQGDKKYGFAIHLIEGKPAFTVNYDGLTTVLKAKEALQDGPVTLRALFGLDGTLAIGAVNGPGASGYGPMEGGFSRTPSSGLQVAMPSDILPNATPFAGELARATLSLLPGMTVELRAAKAVPVE